MQIQINNGVVTYYSMNSYISSRIELNEEMQDLVEQLEDYIREQRTPEQVAVDRAEEERMQAMVLAEERGQEISTLNRRIREIVNSFEQWSPESVEYEVDDILSYRGELYRVIQAHTSQESWSPIDAESLFTNVTNRTVGEETGEPQEWVEPTGSHDAYHAGDVVLYEGTVYVSTIDNNVWSPLDHPQGWEVVDD